MPVTSQGNHRFNISIEPVGASDHHLFFEGLWDTLEAAGWVAVEHSDGTTVAAGRGAIQNTVNAWKLYRNPSSTMWVRAQRNTTAQWRMFIDTTLPTGGTASTMPSHADSVQLIGTSGGFASLNTDSSTVRAHVWANTEETSNGFRPFYFLLMTRGVATSLDFYGVETLDQVADGVSGDADTQDYVLYRTTGSITNFSRSGGANKFIVWYRKGLTGAAIDSSGGVAFGQVNVNASHSFPGGINFTDPYTGLYKKARCWVGSNTSGRTQAPKGRAIFFRFPGPDTSIIGNFQRLDPTTTEAYLRLTDFLVPWPQNTASPI